MSTVKATTMKIASLQAEKKLVREFHAALEDADTTQDIKKVLDKYTSGDSYRFRSVYPFREINGAPEVSQIFWEPLFESFTRLQRRQDIFIAGKNSVGDGIWVLSMGHFMGLFDQDWIGIRASRQIATIRYAEFTRVKDDVVQETGLFLDLTGLLQAAGMNPLPPSTGTYFCYPGPRTHDGLLYDDAPPAQGLETQALVDRMVDDLSAINGSMTCAPEVLERTWSKDMLWYGPAGVGATYTIERYQEQHQLPFRSQLADKRFNGHVARIAEGNYAAFFGWPNLTNSPTGGWMGLPGGSKDCDLQVVDVYRREGDKLAENWVFIDILWYLKQQGVDVLERTTRILNPMSLKKKSTKRIEIEDAEKSEPPAKKIALMETASVVSQE